MMNRYKKSVETCHAHRTNGIAKHRSRNEQKNKYPTLFVYTLQSTAWGCTRTYTKQNERISSLPFYLKLGDFFVQDKARNAFLAQGFLPSGTAKLVQGERKRKFICKFSEPQPNFFLRSKIKLVQAEWNIKFICKFPNPPMSLISRRRRRITQRTRSDKFFSRKERRERGAKPALAIRRVHSAKKSVH